MAEVVALTLWEIGAAWATDAAVFLFTNATAINTLALYTASAANGAHQKRKAAAAARRAYNDALQDRLVMTSTASAPRSRIYGRVRNADGVVFKGTHGTNSEFYTMVIALAGHQVDAIETVYANDVALTLDVDGYCQTAPYLVADNASISDPFALTSSGSVTLSTDPVASSVSLSWTEGTGAESASGQCTIVSVVGRVVTYSGGPTSSSGQANYQSATGTSYLRVRKFLGAPGQDLYSTLEPLVGTQVDTTDHFDGIACLVVTMEFNTDAYPAGVPGFSAVMRGAQVYDPRSSTTAWSENPALIARDWALYANGGGCVSGEINAAAFSAAANVCDVSTTFTTASGDETRPLYQCGIAIPLDSNPDEVLAEIVESMAGQWGWAGGMLTLRAGAYRAPVATITESWITDQSDIAVVNTATADLVNVMRPSLADAASHYTQVPAAEVRSASYIAADGRELAQELTLGAVTRTVHAQHVCGVLMREARDGLTVTLPCNLRAFALELFDVVAVTLDVFGWSAKEFEVMGWEFSLQGGVQLTLRETAAAIYTPDSLFLVATTSANTHLPDPTVVPQVTGVAATSNTTALSDNSIVSRLAVTWAAVASQAVAQSGRIEVQAIEATTTPLPDDWPAQPLQPGGATTVTISGVRANINYLVRVRAINSLGVRGKWSLQVLHQVAGPRQRRIYHQASAPSTGAADGDLWFDTDDSNKQYLRESGAWVSVRDSGIQAALDAAAAAEAAADGKIASYYQTSNPGPSSDGDLWFDSDDGNKQYVYTGGSWVLAADTRIGTALSDAADAQATADGKVTTFVSGATPTAEGIGDLWIDSANGNRIKRWSGSAWVLLPMGTAAIDTGAVTTVYDFAYQAGPLVRTNIA